MTKKQLKRELQSARSLLTDYVVNRLSDEDFNLQNADDVVVEVNEKLLTIIKNL